MGDQHILGFGEDILRLDEHPISRYFGCNTFNDTLAKARLSHSTYMSLKSMSAGGGSLTPEMAQEVATAIKDWAMEQGATHFTHWFLPMTGVTAEKHDAFIFWDKNNPGTVIETLSGSQLIQGEPDASSFPSGGLRATFEARGYTAWDPSSPVFIMGGPSGKTLCIPTAFVGYHGEALDHKVPLLRSMESLSKEALDALKFFKHPAQRVLSVCGAEQEYFAVDLELAQQRPDLMFANRTLQGARPPKGQELEDHYFGSIKDRVLGFMQQLELEALKLGIPVKTRHNEVAPNQFELAPIFEQANLASDHNQLLMELMKSIGERHGLAILLHEKPFAGINGSGKHCNWSLATDQGQNLLDPGKTPEQNLQFIYFLTATIKAIHRHGGLLRAAIASAANDHRLGANEAPPAIMSIFLGAQLSQVLDIFERGENKGTAGKGILSFGIPNLPDLEKDATDRNRTSPFAFTGNRFEFRAVGSSQPIAFPLMIINTAVTEALQELNHQVQQDQVQSGDVLASIIKVVQKTLGETKSIRFEGNGYSDEWKQEAGRRGLPHAADTVAALKIWEEPAAQSLFIKGGIFSAQELEARLHIRHEQYQKALNIEAQVLREMTETLLIPSILSDIGDKSQSIKHSIDAGQSVLTKDSPIGQLINRQANLLNQAQSEVMKLREILDRAENQSDMHARTETFGYQVRPAMDQLRQTLDKLEELTDAAYWPIPKYRELLAPLI